MKNEDPDGRQTNSEYEGFLIGYLHTFKYQGNGGRIMNKVTYTNKPDFNLIAETLSYLLSKELDADIRVTMTPKSEEQLRKEGLIQ